MDKLAFLPPFITLFFLIYKGFGWTFIYWWIPVMLLVPVYFQVDGPGIPPMTFYLTGFAPFIFTRELWRSAIRDFHWLDLFVYAFIIVIGMSEFETTGFSSGRQLIFLNTLIFLGPFLAMKYVILHEKGELNTARVFVIILSIIALYNIYTFRFGVSHFLWLRERWPMYYEVNNPVVIPRWGFFRAQGPFVHPIAAGIAFGFGLPMTFWLFFYRKFKPLWLGPATIFLCTLGLIMTMSRGPYLGAFLSTGLYLVGQSKFRNQLFVIGGVIMFFLCVPLGFKVAEYISLDRMSAKTDEQETVLYRKELITNYIDVIKKKPFLGYGFLNIPYVGDQQSIDNAYLLYALNWGVFSVLLIVGMVFCSVLCLFRLGFSSSISPINRGIVWALIGGLIGCSFSMTTVHLARPLNTIMFMWVGWTAALMYRRQRASFGARDNAVRDRELPPSQEPRKMVIL